MDVFIICVCSTNVWVHDRVFNKPFAGRVLSQVLVEDGGGDEGAGVFVLCLQISQVSVSPAIRTYQDLTNMAITWLTRRFSIVNSKLN